MRNLCVYHFFESNTALYIFSFDYLTHAKPTMSMSRAYLILPFVQCVASSLSAKDQWFGYAEIYIKFDAVCKLQSSTPIAAVNDDIYVSR